MDHLLSDRIRRVTESQTLVMTKKARELSAQGVHVINLSIGEPDFGTPDHIIQAAHEALDAGYTKYPPVTGYADLREAISEKFRKENGLDYTAEQIVVSSGAKHSIMNVIMSLVNQGDEVIIPAPYWVSYTEMVKLAGGVPVILHSSIENNYQFDPDELRKVLNRRSKLFLFSSPCNPSGTVFHKDFLDSVANVLAQHPDILVVSDEIYEHIQYTGKHISIGTNPKLKDRVITVNGVSKGFAMTGWRIGYIGAPLWVAKACEKLQGQFTSGANSIAQRATLAALTQTLAPTKQMNKTFKKRRDFVVKALEQIPGIVPNKPEGAFYVFPDVSVYFGKMWGDKVIHNSLDLCLYLLDVGHVSLVSGSAFGNPECVRISYAASMEDLKEAMKRMEEALAKLTP
ncbi:MAG: pyridoxal phosphate-dependent aminotransferase [Flavobacteriales bacterium]|nr:pyridoxal phosphate-dependent aminotransferase [Flavobacteriales bacterium]